MFFGVFFLQPSVHVIIPKTWIQGIDDHWEKFVNFSLNHNQTFRCFYSQELNALDVQGQPNVNFVPNFELDLAEFPNEGCYFGKLIFFKQNFDAAIERLKHRRPIVPGLYNEKRLYEVPIPHLEASLEGETNQITAQEDEDTSFDSDNEQEGIIVDQNVAISTPLEHRHIENVLINENDFEATINNSSTKTSSSQNDPLLDEVVLRKLNGTEDLSNFNLSVDQSVPDETEEPNTANLTGNASENIYLLQTTPDELQMHNIHSQFNQSNAPEYNSQNDISTEGDIENSTEAADSAANGTTSLKSETFLVMQQPESNRNELEVLLNDEDMVEEQYEGMVITYKRNKGYAKPYDCNTEDLIKYENDVVSGSMPYKSKVNKAEFFRFIHNQIIHVIYFLLQF